MNEWMKCEINMPVTTMKTINSQYISMNQKPETKKKQYPIHLLVIFINFIFFCLQWPPPLEAAKLMKWGIISERERKKNWNWMMKINEKKNLN